MPVKSSSAREVSELAVERSKSLENKGLVWQFEADNLGRNLDRKEEVVPLKKRKFLFQSPPSPPRNVSPRKESDDGALERSGVLKNCSASANDVAPVVKTERDADEKNVDRVVKQEDESQDFSGISLLADAVCTKNAAGGEANVEIGPGFADSCSLSLKISKEDLTSAEITVEGTASCVTLLPKEEPDGTNVESKGSPNGSSVKLEDLRTKKEDVRLHWDLNTTMDMWEPPSNNQSQDMQNTTSDVTSEDMKDSNLVDDKANLEFRETQLELGVKCEDSASKGNVDGEGIKSSDEMSPNDPDTNFSSAVPEADNGSQYEDGEVRESIEHVDYDPDCAESLGYENEERVSIYHSWEDYDGEDLTPEHTECVSGDGISLGSKNEVPSRPGSTRTEKLPLETNVKEPSQPTYMETNVSRSDNRRENGSRYNNVGRDSTNQASSESAFIRKLGLRRNCDAALLNPRYDRESGYVPRFTRGRYYANSHPSDSHRNPARLHPGNNYHAPASYRGRNVERGGHWHQDRRRSPVDRDEAFDRRMSRERSPDRRPTYGRGRHDNYGGGPRRRYHSPIPDDEVNVHPRRERSSSSMEERSWSPSFRTDARMQRGRFVHQRPRFDDVHDSQPYNARRFDREDGMFRNGGARSFDRDSRDQRFPVDNRRNRFEEFGDNTNRNNNYRGRGRGGGRGGFRNERFNDYRDNKPDYEYSEVHRARQYDNRVKRIRYDEDGFSAPAPHTGDFHYRKEYEDRGVSDAPRDESKPVAMEEGEDNQTSKEGGAS